ncbi:hypothetical protein Bca4012_050331 [Brassica carinata]
MPPMNPSQVFCSGRKTNSPLLLKNTYLLSKLSRSPNRACRPPMQIVSVNWLRKDAVPCGLGHVPCFPTIDHKFQPLPYVQSKPNKYSPQLPLRFDH